MSTLVKEALIVGVAAAAIAALFLAFHAFSLLARLGGP